MPRLPGDLEFIYAFACLEFVKIGRATSWRSRLHGMQTGCPFPITKLLVVRVRAEMAGVAERFAHDLLRDAHHRGEWFKNVPLERVKSTLMRARGEAGRRLPIGQVRPDDLRALDEERARLQRQEAAADENLRAYRLRVAPTLTSQATGISE